MADEVEKFDPSKLMQGVRDRIKATFVSLIPDTQWDEMVKKEIDSFFDERKVTISKKVSRSQSYGSSTIDTTINGEQMVSAFREMVWEICNEKAAAVLREKLKEEYFTNIWENNQYQVTDKMKSIIAESAPLAATKFFEMISMSMMENLKNQIQSFR